MSRGKGVTDRIDEEAFHVFIWTTDNDSLNSFDENETRIYTRRASFKAMKEVVDRTGRGDSTLS